MTDQINERGQYVLENHVLVTFVLEGTQDIKLEGFNQQNVLSGIALERTSGGYELTLEEGYGVGGKIRADHLRIELEPGKPPQNIQPV